MNSANSVEHLLLYLSGHSNPFTNRFYITWLLQSYTFNGGMSNGQPISKVLQALLKNITKINGCEKQMIEIVFATSDNQALFENILSVFMAALREPRQLEQLCVKYVEITESLTDRQLNRWRHLELHLSPQDCVLGKSHLLRIPKMSFGVSTIISVLVFLPTPDLLSNQ